MATLADEILSCMLRSFCADHAMSFERFHTKFPKLKKWLDSPEADKSLLYEVFPTYPHTITVEKWNLFSNYLKSEEGREYRRMCQHWPKYAKICIEGCKRCYLKAEGTDSEKYVVDRMYMLVECKKDVEKREIEKRYPENYGTFLLNQGRKRRRLREFLKKGRIL